VVKLSVSRSGRFTFGERPLWQIYVYTAPAFVLVSSRGRKDGNTVTMIGVYVVLQLSSGQTLLLKGRFESLQYLRAPQTNF
jgi:hypothetical protein